MCVAALIWMAAVFVLPQLMADQQQASIAALVVGTLCVVAALIVTRVIVNRPSRA